MTPFHNMALMCPATTEADVDRHTEVFAGAVDALLSSEATSRCRVGGKWRFAREAVLRRLAG